MLKQLESLAEKAATGVSRRGFLAAFSKSAVAAAALGGLLAASQSAEAGRGLKCCPSGMRCIPPRDGCTLIACVQVSDAFLVFPGCRWDCGGTIIDTTCGTRRGVGN